jgi:hypothetical protein
MAQLTQAIRQYVSMRIICPTTSHNQCWQTHWSTLCFPITRNCQSIRQPVKFSRSKVALAVNRSSMLKQASLEHSHTVSCSPAIIAALMPPATGNVTSQATTMFRNIDQSTFSRARNRPTKTTEPTLQCVVLIGMPTFDAIRTVRADPISIQKPLKQKIFTTVFQQHDCNCEASHQSILTATHF